MKYRNRYKYVNKSKELPSGKLPLGNLVYLYGILRREETTKYEARYEEGYNITYWKGNIFS